MNFRAFFKLFDLHSGVRLIILIFRCVGDMLLIGERTSSCLGPRSKNRLASRNLSVVVILIILQHTRAEARLLDFCGRLEVPPQDRQISKLIQNRHRGLLVIHDCEMRNFFWHIDILVFDHRKQRLASQFVCALT